jgi:hypothetical protein
VLLDAFTQWGDLTVFSLLLLAENRANVALDVLELMSADLFVCFLRLVIGLIHCLTDKVGSGGVERLF